MIHNVDMKNCSRFKKARCLSEVNPQPLTNFYKIKNGYCVQCKSCRTKSRWKKKIDSAIVIDGMKYCSRFEDGKCLSVSNPQTTDNFWSHPNTLSGLKSACKCCEIASNKEWKIKNPEYHFTDEYRIKKAESHRRTSYRVFKKNKCESCSFIALDSCQLDIDHIDGDHFNDDPKNMQTLCANCHRLKSKLNKENGRPRLEIIKGGNHGSGCA